MINNLIQAIKENALEPFLAQFNVKILRNNNMIIRSSVCASLAAQDSAGVWSERTFSNLAVFVRWLPDCKDGGVRAEAPPSHYPSFVIFLAHTKGQRAAKCWLMKSSPGGGVRMNSLATSWTAQWPPQSTPSSITPSLPSRE